MLFTWNQYVLYINYISIKKYTVHESQMKQQI